MGSITLGARLRVPAAEYATQVTAAIGMRGTGKSNTLTVGIEGLLGAKVQVVVLDPVGIHFGLRLGADGKRASGFEIAVLGGLHGDIALQPHAGKLVAESLAASGAPAVLDISGFSKGDRIRFAADFAETFFDAKKKNPAPVQLVLEEAQRFAPQMIRYKGTGLERCLGAIEEIAEIGRNYGIGLAMASQRPQKINKDVLNLTEFLFCFQLAGVHERKAISEWVQEKGAEGRKDVSGELPSLKRGSALVWSPAWLGVYGKYTLHKKTTYDAGATPLHARKSVKTKPLNLSALEKSMAAVVEEAKQNDPKALKRRIAELERELQKKQPAGHVETKTIEVAGPIPEEVWNALDSAQNSAAHITPLIRDALNKLNRYSKQKPKTVGVEKTNYIPPSRSNGSPARVIPFQPRVIASSGSVDMSLSHGARRMLLALASTHAKGLTRRQLGTLGKVKSSGGTFATYLSKLKVSGYITFEGNLVCITPEGRGAAGDVGEAPTSKEELLHQWRDKLPGKTFEMLQVIIEAGEINKTALGELVGIEPSGGTFATYISKLRANGLIDGSGTYRPSSAWEGLT